MARYVPIPKDLNDIKEKFIMGFTKRQVICFGIGLVLGAPVYFLTRMANGSISEDQTGIMPASSPASGKPPLPSKRLPRVRLRI